MMKVSRTDKDSSDHHSIGHASGAEYDHRPGMLPMKANR
jgi:hypothetical protein